MMKKPRLGFLGAGWIGRSRLKSVVESNLADVVVIADPDAVARAEARAIAPASVLVGTYEELLEAPLDAVVIATPSGLHAEHCTRALQKRLAVFCQKPLAPTASEVEGVIEEARRVDRLLRVDFSYRESLALRRTRQVIRSGEIGRVYAVDLVFHNAYGPGQTWARDVGLAGGGCLMDLGVHLLDAVFWILEQRPVARSPARLYAAGRALSHPGEAVEDFAAGELVLQDGCCVRLACSWRSAFGDEARIAIAFFGTNGGVSFENVSGSFYDFRCERYRGSSRDRLVSPPDAWSGRTILRWLGELAESRSYRDDPALLEVANALDALYGRSEAKARPANRTRVAGAR